MPPNTRLYSVIVPIISHKKAQKAQNEFTQFALVPASFGGAQTTWSSQIVFVPFVLLVALLWLTFGVLEDRVADFDAVGNRQNTGFLALTPVFKQHRAIRR